MNKSVSLFGFIFVQLQVLLFNGGRLQAIPVDDNGKLILSHVIYRHGDRTPTGPYPNDPNTDESAWPVEYGELTNEGTRQHYILGQFLRFRYFTLLPARYSPKQVYVRSTDVDRTMESAQANLAGLYPPAPQDKWNAQLNWNPIPVHVVPAEYDFLIGGLPPKCNTFDKALDELTNSEEYDIILAKSKDLRDYLTEHSGYNLNATSNYDAMLNSLQLRDTLFVERKYNMIMPEWTKSLFPNKEFDELALLWYTLHTKTPELATVRVGYLLNEIIDHCLSKVAGTLDGLIYQYSSHDALITNFLNGLGIYDNKFVNYASCILVELRVKDKVPYLQIFYKNDPYKPEATPMCIPQCGYSCKLSDFINLYSNILPTEDFNTHCKN